MIYLGNKQIGMAAIGVNAVTRFGQNFYDTDAIAFINAAGITGSAIGAVNNLVVSLKYENLWDSFDCIYPMVGANATAHKYNLKNPQDTDAAYRLNFSGSWVHNSNGAKPNGTDAYANTYYNFNTNLTNSNGAYSYYSFTSSSAADMAEMGAITTAGPTGNDSYIRALYVNERFYWTWGGGDPNAIPAVKDSRGFYITNAQTTTTLDGWKNGVELKNNGVTFNRPLPNLNCYLGAFNFNGTASAFSDRGCSFATIGDTIASGKEATFSSIVNNFQIELGRYSY